MRDSGRVTRLVLLAVAVLALLARAFIPEESMPGAAREAIAEVAATTVPATTATVPRALPEPPEARPVTLASRGGAPVISRLPITEKVVFLGIDDGMVRDPAVLARIERERIPVTAFLTLAAVQDDPAYWKRAVAAGVRIQSHTVNHPDLTRVSREVLRTEVCGTIEPFTALTGRRPTLFRPPYGLWNGAVVRQARECGYRAVALWKGSTNNGLLTMQQGALHAGDLILMHWRDSLLADLDDVIARCRREGFTIGYLEDYLP